MVAEFHYPQKDKYKQVKFDLSEDSVTSNHGVVTESGLEEDIQGEDSKPVHRVFDQRTPNLSSGRRNNFLPTISFDTVPIQGVSPDDDDYDDYLDLHACSKSHENNYRLDYTLEEYYNNEDINYNCDYHNNWCYANSEGQRTVSPMRSQSPSFRNTAGIMGKYDVLPDGRRVRIDYPSKPTLLSDSVVINRTHRSWRSLWKSRKDQIELRIQKATLWYRYPEILFPKAEVDLSDLPVVSDEGIAYSSNQRAQMKRVAKVIRTPVGFPVSPRTLLCHISGRKHTWVALDWVVLNFMRNTDHIVVVASLPRSTSRYGCRSISGSRSRSRSRSIRRSSSMNPNSSFTSNGADSMVKDKNEEWSEGYSVGKIEGVLNNLIEYINFIIPTDLAIKVTVEFMIGKTKQVLIESLNLHSPDLIIASTLQYKENDGLVDQKSKRLTSVLAKFYPFPVFIVPAKRMAGFESKMEAEVNSRHRDEAQTSDKHREVGYTEPDSTSFRPRLSAMRTSPSVLIHENASSNEVFGKLDTSDLVSVDSERSDSVLDRIDRTSTVTSSYDRVAKLRENYREKVQEDFSSIEMDNTLPISQKHFAKLDAVVSASIDFNTELERSDSPSILELQRIITGGEKHKGFRKKSMLDVFDMPTNKPKRGRQPGAAKSQDGDPTPRKSTIIKFGANVKGADGSSVLQQGTADEPLQDISPLRQVKSLSQSNLRTSSSTSNSLRKVRSASNNVLNRTKSNDSVNSGSKRKRGGLLGALFGSSNSGSTSTVTSPATSRRSSLSSNENVGVSSVRRKKRWGFLK